MLMLTAPVLLLPQAGARLVNRGLSPRILITVSLLLIATGNAWLTVLHPGIGAIRLLGPLATIGIGMGLVIGTTDAQAMNQVEPDRIGMATGLLNTVRAGGATLVTTLFGTALINLLQARTGTVESAARVASGDLTGPDRVLRAAQFTEAWHIASWSIAVLCVAAAITIWILLAPTRRPSAMPLATEPSPGPQSPSLQA
jgi:hypothetical protein